MRASPRSIMLAFAWVAGCGGSQSQVNATQFPAYAATQQPHAQVVYGDAIQPGTHLTVQVAASNGRDVSRPGQPIVATVAAPLVDPGGRVIVPRGAEVSGYIGRLESGSRMHFDRLRVGSAMQPIRTRVIAIHGTPAGSALTLEIESPIPLALLRGSGSSESGGAYGGGPSRR